MSSPSAGTCAAPRMARSACRPRRCASWAGRCCATWPPGWVPDPGQRDVRQAGAAGERSGATREWAFGDVEPWDVTRTLTRAIQRTATEGEDPRQGVRIRMGDIEVTETEARTRAVVALLVDTSFSMAMDGRWVPMKRTALALHHLVGTRFRGDHLQLIGFGRHASVMDIERLTALEPKSVTGTNLHHALLLANRWFRKHPADQPILLVVTDGEPTAHLEADGRALFNYPPDPMTIRRTIEELEAAGRLGAQVTFFRLGDDPGLARFVDSMARRVDGRVLAPELDDLGAAVVGSYLGSRHGRGWGVRQVQRLVRRPRLLGAGLVPARPAPGPTALTTADADLQRQVERPDPRPPGRAARQPVAAVPGMRPALAAPLACGACPWCSRVVSRCSTCSRRLIVSRVQTRSWWPPTCWSPRAARLPTRR